MLFAVSCCVPLAFLFGCWVGFCVATRRQPWNGRYFSPGGYSPE